MDRRVFSSFKMSLLRKIVVNKLGLILNRKIPGAVLLYNTSDILFYKKVKFMS